MYSLNTTLNHWNICYEVANKTILILKKANLTTQTFLHPSMLTQPQHGSQRLTQHSSSFVLVYPCFLDFQLHWIINFQESNPRLLCLQSSTLTARPPLSLIVPWRFLIYLETSVLHTSTGGLYPRGLCVWDHVRGLCPGWLRPSTTSTKVRNIYSFLH